MHRASREFLLGEYRAGCFAPFPRTAQLGRHLQTYWGQSQDGLKQPIFIPQLLGDNGGAISPAQSGVRTCCQRSMGSYCGLTMETFSSQESLTGWS